MARPGTRTAFLAIVALGVAGGVTAKVVSDNGSEPREQTATTFSVPATLPPPETYPARPATTSTAPPATTTTTTAAPGPRPAPRATPTRPPIVEDLIPFPASRKQEMAAYAQRHYGLDTFALRHPKVIVEHVAVAPSAASVKATFTPDTADPELHELPNVCSHFVVDRDGTIHQLVPLGVMCRHTVGLNYTAIGIEHAGYTDSDVLGNPAELRASLALTNWLRCRYGISIRNVIGHNESLGSPYHHENVAALRSQTHGDMQRAAMDAYRARLSRMRCR